MNTITLFKANGGWMSRWSDPSVAHLFGTDTVPTPFTDEASADMVRDVIERLNPGDQVIIQEGN